MLLTWRYVTACEGTTKETVLSVVSDEYICLNYDQFYIAYTQMLFSPKAFSYRICAVGISVRVQEWTSNVTQKFRFMLYIIEFLSEFLSSSGDTLWASYPDSVCFSGPLLFDFSYA